MKLTIYFALHLTILLVVSNLVKSEDLVDGESTQPENVKVEDQVINDDPPQETSEQVETEATTEPKTEDGTTPAIADKSESGTTVQPDDPITEPQTTAPEPEPETEPPTTKLPEPETGPESGPETEPGTELPTTAAPEAEPEHETEPQTTKLPEPETGPETEPGTELPTTKVPEPEPETESPAPEPTSQPKISFWQKVKFALSPKSSHFYIFIGVFGFIFIALLVFCFSRLFVHPQQRDEYTISSASVERGRDNLRLQTFQLEVYNQTTGVTIN